MTVKEEKSLYRGAMGDLVFRVVNGKQEVKQRAIRRQTEQSKKSRQWIGTDRKRGTRGVQALDVLLADGVWK